MSWDANRPRDRDNLRELGELWRSDKSFLDDYLQTFVWWSNSVTNAGRPSGGSELTVSGAVAFVVPRSQVSYRRDGDLFLVSDESRFVMSRSNQTVPLFSDKAVIQYHNNTDGGGAVHSLNTNSRVMMTHGVNTLTANDQIGVNFGVTYGAPPTVAITATSTNDASSNSFLLGLSAITESGMTLWTRYVGPGASPGNVIRAMWRSSGTTGVIL